MNLYPHQIEKSKELEEIVRIKNIAYLIGEVRSGKTLTVLETAKNLNAKNVLFLTKKKAISSIESDFSKMGYSYNITVTNYENLHKIEGNFDLVIYDEAHVLSAFPKPAKRTRAIRERFFNIPCILMSGTPATESYSQYFHQLWISSYTPFKGYGNFYKWAKDFVNVVKKRIGTHEINDYSDADYESIQQGIKDYTVTMTQSEAGLTVDIKEHILRIEPPEWIDKLAKKLIKDRAVEGRQGYIMAETPASLQTKIHQIYSGTVIIETFEGESKAIVLNDYKAEYIKQYFKGNKIAIFYYYQAELTMLLDAFGDGITTDLEEFNNTDKNFAIQFNTSEGMNLSKADYIVYMNLGFSGRNFIQSLDRMTTRERTENEVYFIIEKGGINEKILKAVKNKETYNLKSFRTDYL